MPDFPVSLDQLIAHVKALQTDGQPLGLLSEAVDVAGLLDERSDALIGYFVDQARSSGATWSQIGASMGVSKQAAQKRFVLRDDDTSPENKAFSRFTPRARNAVAAAGQAAVEAGAIDTSHLVAGLLTEPEGLAVKIIRRLGTTEKEIYETLGVRPTPGDIDADPAALRELRFSESTRTAFRAALRTALGLGHNYIGTEHLLVGAVSSQGETIDALAGLGLTPDLVKSALTVELAQYKLDRQRQAG